MTLNPDARPLTIEQVGAKLQKSTSTVWRLIRRGVLHTERYFGRTVIWSDELEQLMRSGTASAREL
jgi:predicted DNA-binding transcriptional regulator AlpA